MKSLRRSTSILLSVLLLFGIVFIALEPTKVGAVEYSNVPEYPDFDMDCYVADLFTTEGRMLNTSIELEMNSKTTNDVMKNGIESNSVLMNSMTAWQVATFEASDVTHDTVTQIGYYESIILSSLNTVVKSSRVKNAFDNAVIKDGKMLFSSFKDILKSEYFITDFSLETYKTLSAEQQSAYIKSFGEAFKKQYPKLDKTSDVLKTFSTVVTAAKSFEECMNNFAAYSHCSLVNQYMCKVVNDLYEQCPAEKVTLKAALLNISSACTSVELDLGVDALDAIYRGSDVLFGIITDGWVSKIISAHPAGLALMIGRTVGKSVSNILFSTDAICENYYKMCCFDEFEKLVRSITKYEMNIYKKDKSNYNANCLFWAVRLMFGINEESCDLTNSYAKTIYEDSVAGIFLDKTEYENFKKSVESIRQSKQLDYSSLITSYIFYLEEDYPEIYAAYMKLEDEIENSTVHTTGVSFSKKHMKIGLDDDVFFFWNNAEVSPTNASNKVVTYTSSDESVVSIKPANTLDIEVHKVGTAVITATTEDGGFTDTMTIDVVEGHGSDGVHIEEPVTDIKSSGKCGDNAYWNLYNNGLLKIYGTGKIFNYSYGSAPWFGNRHSIKKVVIGDSVKSIGERAFVDCTSLTSITIPDSVTSIGNKAFEGCKSLTSITIPDSVTSIGKCAFYYCTSLTSITIPDSVKSIGESAFYYCTSLTSITIPDSVKSIGESAFHYCTSLTSITIPDSVTSIGNGAFEDCTRLASITIPDSVKSIGERAFEDCTNLTSITIPDSVTSIGYCAFRCCASLTSITIPDSVTNIGYSTFCYCTSLASITIPDSVTSIEYCAFSGCTSLTSITIPASVTYIGTTAFGYYDSGTEKLDDFTIYGYKNTTAETYANDNRFSFISLDNLTEQTYTDKLTGVTVTSRDEAEITIANITKDIAVLQINVPSTELVSAVYNLAMIKNGTTVQPIGPVTVKLPVASEKSKVYTIDVNGSTVEIKTLYSEGYLVFDTATLGTFAVVELSTEPEVQIGDVNLDGEITITDVTAIQRHLADIEKFNDEQLALADTNGDGHLDISDATHLQKYIAKFDGVVLGKYIERIVGDVNGDGEVTIDDAELLIKRVNTNYEFVDLDYKISDINQDGKINAIDALTITKHLNGDIINENIGKPIIRNE